MTIISKLMGKASSTDAEKITEEIKHILIEDEKVELAFKVFRDSVVFTNLRIIFIDYRGVTGKKREYMSVPYSAITHFAVETSGHIDLDFDFKVWIIGRGPVIEKKLRRDKDVAYQVSKILTRYTTTRFASS